MPKTKAVRARLRKDAEERQAEYDKLTIQQKLDRLPAKPHAERQRARLMAALSPKSNSAFIDPSHAEEHTEEVSNKPKKLKAKERRAKNNNE